MPHRSRSLVLAAWLLGAGLAHAQQILWTETYGGPDEREIAWAMDAAPGGGFVLAGYWAPPLEGGGGADDFLLLKSAPLGGLEWSRVWGGVWSDWLTAVRSHPDGGYLLAGMYGIAPFTHDAYLARTDAQGNLVWQQFYGAGGLDTRAHDVRILADGGYVVAGQRWVPSGPFGSYDVRLIRTDPLGNVIWDRTYAREAEGNDFALAVEPMPDGGFALAGSTQSSAWACYLLRVDSLGNLIWDEVYGGGFAGGSCDDLEPLPDGGLVATGCATPAGDCDTFLVRTDAAGGELWSRNHGNAGGDDTGHALLARPDGGFLIAGISSATTPGWAVNLVRTDSDGLLLWEQTWGGALDDRGTALVAGPPGQVAVAGFTTPAGNSVSDALLLMVADGESAPPAIFADGFESGDTGAWSFVLP